VTKIFLYQNVVPNIVYTKIDWREGMR